VKVKISGSHVKIIGLLIFFAYILFSLKHFQKNIYKIKNSNGQRQTVDEHLKNVGILTAGYIRL